MQVLTLLKNGKVIAMPCVRCYRGYSPNGFMQKAACLWVSYEHAKDALLKAGYDISKDGIHDAIDGAEAPYEIYHDCESHTPWKHYGLLAFEVKFIDDELLWWR